MIGTCASSRSRQRSARTPAHLAGALLALALGAVPAAARAADACAGKVRRPTAATTQGDPEAVLAATGVWIEVASHGLAWRPCVVGPGWRPYFHGSWRWTREGWFWVSAEPWGAVTYHYGRWLFEPSQGWVWLPGKTWAPAWVRWRSNHEVVGWAPLEPDGPTYSAFWTFVPAARLEGEEVEAIALPPPRVPALLLRTKQGLPASTRSAPMCSPAAPCPSPRPPPPARSTS